MVRPGSLRVVALTLACATVSWAAAPRPADAHAGRGQPGDVDEAAPSHPTAVTARPIPAVDPRRAATVALRHVKTGERYELRLFDESGQIRHEARDELRDFLACARTGDDHPIHWRLATILVAIGSRWPGQTIEVVSGYRHPAVSRHAKRSNHTRGRAIDLRVVDVPNRVLRDAIRGSFAGVGVGYYPNSSFVHIDIRERDAQWIDYAGPGRSACYSRNVDAELRSGQAERISDAQARLSVCPTQASAIEAEGGARTPAGAKTAALSPDDDEHGGVRTRSTRR